jgi:CDP-diacylglycerol---glycerol-3-phosphate 3-phosphatidyltransferase
METFRDALAKLLIPVGKLLALLKINPNLISFSGIIFGFASAYCFVLHYWIPAVVLFALSGFSDVFDGMVARNRGIQSPFGSFFDNFCSAYADSPVFIGLILGNLCSPGWGLAALVGTLTRLLTFRLEGLLPKEEAQALRSRFPYALAGKGDRIVLVSIGTVWGHINEAVMLIAVLTNMVAVFRSYHLYSWGKRPGPETSAEGL